MEINVMSWNMAGAKLLHYLDSSPSKVASSYIDAYNNVWQSGIVPFITIPPNKPQYPDIILLQECIGFVDTSCNPSGRWQSGEEILQNIYQGYKCFFFPAFSSHTNPHPGRWQKYRQGSDIPNYLPDYVEAQQGYGICIRYENTLRKLWVTEKNQSKILADSDEPGNDYHLCFESINTTTGLYLGGRDTEPRLVIMGRVKIGSQGVDERYLNFLNIHLTTIKGERIGNIRLNRIATEYRMKQLDLILNNIISAYQEANTYRVTKASENRKEDIWIIGGDLNATPDSEELSLVKRMGFIDGNPDKSLVDANQKSPFHNQIGTKWSLSDYDLPPIVLDYILCGLERTTFPTGSLKIINSRRPYRPLFGDRTFETDHAVLFASFGI